MTPDDLKKLLATEKQKPKRKKRKASTPTNGLTKAIKDYINFNGGRAYRVNSGAVYDPVKKTFRSGGADKGISDIIAIKKPGRFVGVEVKGIKSDKLRESQIRFRNEIQKVGGVFIEARSLDSFIEQWNKI